MPVPRKESGSWRLQLAGRSSCNQLSNFSSLDPVQGSFKNFVLRSPSSSGLARQSHLDQHTRARRPPRPTAGAAPYSSSAQSQFGLGIERLFKSQRQAERRPAWLESDQQSKLADRGKNQVDISSPVCLDRLVRIWPNKIRNLAPALSAAIIGGTSCVYQVPPGRSPAWATGCPRSSSRIADRAPGYCAAGSIRPDNPLFSRCCRQFRRQVQAPVARSRWHRVSALPAHPEVRLPVSLHASITVTACILRSSLPGDRFSRQTHQCPTADLPHREIAVAVTGLRMKISGLTSSFWRTRRSSASRPSSDHLDIGLANANLTDQLQASHSRQAQIGDQQVKRKAGRFQQGLFGRRNHRNGDVRMRSLKRIL